MGVPEGSPVRVVKNCDVRTLPRVQVEALIECGRLQPLAMSDEAAGGGSSLRQVASGSLLSAEVALMWRIVCTWLQVCPAALSRL